MNRLTQFVLHLHAPFLAGFAVFWIAASLIFFPLGSGASGRQPLEFNHSKHIAAGLGCTDCHTGAQTQAHATLPALSFCMSCHESALTSSPEEAKLRALAKAGGELQWHPVTRVPAHVYFSHARHVTAGALKCADCHGAMEKLTAPPPAPAKPLTMTACLDCHSKRGAGEDCNDCHR